MFETGKPISIRDIARIVGVSTATVSNALNGKGHCSEKTRSAVLEVARREGYVTNLAAKGLRQAKSHSIGIITPDVSNEFFSSLVLNIESFMHTKGYTSFICNTANNPEHSATYVRDMVQRNIDGFVFIGGRGGEESKLIGETPTVFIDHLVLDRPARSFYIENDLKRMTAGQTELLIRHGCKRIAFLVIDRHHTRIEDNENFQGFASAIRAASLVLDRNLIFMGSHQQPSRLEATELVSQALNDGITFDGIVAVGDRPAIGAIAALEERGIAVGSEVKVIGTDNSPYSMLYKPSLSTVDRNVDMMARSGVNALAAMLDGTELSATEAVIPHRIVERATTLG